MQVLYNVKDNDKLIWGYSGSLVQQNFGESLYNHGYLQWNIRNQKIIGHNIYNPYGMIKIEFKSNNWVVVGENYLFEQIVTNELFPKENLKIRILGNVHYDNMEILYKILNGYEYTICSHFSIKNNAEKNGNSKVNIEDYSEFNDKKMWIKYIEEQGLLKESTYDWKKIINDPYNLVLDNSLVPTSITDKVTKKNLEIETAIEKFVKSIDHKNARAKIHLRYIEFQWILCFNNNCYFNFSNLKGSVGLISALNGYGKSSFLETICLAIFGQPIPSRYNKSNTSSIISKQKPAGKSCHTRILIEIQGKIYEIYRVYKYQNNDKNKLLMDTTELSIMNNVDTALIIHSGTTAVNNWVKDNIGDINNFLLSCMVSQNQDQDFLSMKSEDQFMLLDKCLRFDSVNALTNLFHTVTKAYKYILDHLDTSLAETRTNINSNIADIVQIEADLKEHMAHKDILQNEYDALILCYSENEYECINDWDIIQENKVLVEKRENYKKMLKNYQYEDLIVKFAMLNEELNKYDASCAEQSINTNNIIIEEPIKPTMTISMINSNNEKINKWKQSWNNINVNTDSIEYKRNEKKNIYDQLLSCNNNLIQYTNNVLHEVSAPSKEYITKHKYIDGFISNYKVFCSVNEIENYCIENYVTQPVTDEITLNNNLCLIYDDKKKINYKYLNDNYKNEHHNLISMLDNKNNYLNQLINDLDVCDRNINRYESIEESIFKDMRSLDVENIMKPNFTEDVIKDKLQEYKTMRKNYKQKYSKFVKLKNIVEKTNCYDYQINQISENKQNITNFIAYLDTYRNIPFNEHCDACNKSPSKIYIADLTQSIIKLDDQLKDINNLRSALLKKKNIEHIQDNYEELQNWITTYNCHDSDEQLYLSYKLAYDQYKIFIQKKKLYSINLDDIRNKLKANRSEYNVIQNSILTIHEELREISMKLKEYQYFKDNKEKWKDAENKIKKQQAQWIEYNTYIEIYKAYLEWKEIETINNAWFIYNRQIEENMQYRQKIAATKIEIKKLQHQLEEIDIYIDSFTKYEIESKYWDNTIKETALAEKEILNWQSWENQCKKKEFSNLQNEILTMQGLLESHKNLKQISKNIDNNLELINDVPKFKRKKEIERLLISTNKIIEQLKEQRTLVLRENMQQNMYTSIIIDINKAVMSINESKEALMLLSTSFTNYRYWVYKHQVLPKLIDNVNSLVSIVCYTNPIKLQYEISNDNVNKISWFLKDGINYLSIEKASGFQKFMLGMALRISLSYIGASTVYCNQLFIDEGWTSCDSKHLEQIPKFIHNLLNIYDSILLVSHLEPIKECSDIKIEIARENSISTIKYGDCIDLKSVKKIKVKK